MDSRHAELLSAIDPITLGHRLRSTRQAAGLTQADLAGDDISVGYVSRIESGQRRPQGAVLESLATRVGVSLDILLSGVEQREIDEIRLALDYAELSLESGQPEEALRQASTGRDQAEQAGQTELAERGRLVQARAHEALAAYDEAILELEDLAASTGNHLTRIRTGIALSRVYRDSGDLQLAIESAQRILGQVSEAGLDGCDEAVQLTMTMAGAYFERGDVGQAVRLCERAMRQAEDAGSVQARAAAYWNASMMQMRRGSIPDAVSLAEKALALFAEGNDARNLARLRSQVGNMYLHQDPPRLDDARRELELAASEMTWSSAGPVDLARNDLSLARAHLLASEHLEAVSLCQRIVDTVGDTSPSVAAQARSIAAQSFALQGATSQALEQLRQAILLLTGIGSDQRAAQQWYELAGLLSDLGQPDAALDAYRSAGAAAGLRSAPRVREAATSSHPAPATSI